MNQAASSFRRLDLVWLVLLTVAGSVLSVVLTTSVFELSVLLSGLLCVGLIAVGRREGYLIGLYNSLTYSILAYGNGLYGEVYLNLLFFVPTGVIGFLMWRRHTSPDKTVVMRRLDWSRRALVAAACVLSTVVLGLVLGRNPDQNTPFLDATTNVLAVAATFLMMGRYKEQWLLYIVLNVVTIGMWVLRARAGGEAGDLMVLMWSLFLLNSVFGYWRWHLGAKGTNRVDAEGDPGEATCDAA